MRPSTEVVRRVWDDRTGERWEVSGVPGRRDLVRLAFVDESTARCSEVLFPITAAVLLSSAIQDFLSDAKVGE